MTTNYPDVTATATGSVVLGKSTYTVERLDFTAYTDAVTGATREAHSEWNLIGARGARYLLRPFLGTDTGVRQVISLGSGSPLRHAGNEVRVIQLGDVIEKMEK